MARSAPKSTPVSETMNRAIVKFCREHKYVARHDLDDWVNSQLSAKHNHKQFEGHAWACLLHMLKTGQVEGQETEPGMVKVTKARLTAPRAPKKKAEQMTWGWEK